VRGVRALTPLKGGIQPKLLTILLIFKYLSLIQQHWGRGGRINGTNSKTPPSRREFDLGFLNKFQKYSIIYP